MILGLFQGLILGSFQYIFFGFEWILIMIGLVIWWFNLYIWISIQKVRGHSCECFHLSYWVFCLFTQSIAQLSHFILEPIPYKISKELELRFYLCLYFLRCLGNLSMVHFVRLLIFLLLSSLGSCRLYRCWIGCGLGLRMICSVVVANFLIIMNNFIHFLLKFLKFG